MELKSGAKLRGKFEIKVYDNKKNMNLISQSECHNIITDEGCNFALDQIGAGAAQVAAVYCVIYEDDAPPIAGSTYAIPSYTECTAYDEATRPEYTPDAAAAKSMDNDTNKAEFTINASKTLYGAALVGGGTDPDTKGDTAGGGKLFCGANFQTPQPVIATNVVNLTYTVTAIDDA